MIYNNRMSLMEKVRMAAYYVTCNNVCSTTKIQKHFVFHFNTASEVVDSLEKLGIVSDFDPEIKGRKVLINSIEDLESKLDFYF
ncbi:MAG: DNA translocase FtsK [Paludibacter sp.]